jgi:hypothetical protein
MPRNSGIYSPTNGSWSNGAVNGALASLADWQTLLTDLSNALTQSVSRDGQSPMTGDLPMGGFKLTGLGAGSVAGQSLTWEQLFAQGTEADVASASTTDIGIQNSNFLRITGTTTITSFGANYRGPRYLRFAGAVTLTNSSTLVLPGGTDFTTTAGDVLVAIPKATSGTADGWYIVSTPQSLSGFITATGVATLTNKTIEAGIFTNGYTEEVATANTSTAYTIDLAGGSVQILTLTGNCTFTFPTATAGRSFFLLLKQDATGGRTVTWPAAVKWPGGTAPTITSTALRLDKYVFTAADSNWYGSVAGQSYTV